MSTGKAMKFIKRGINDSELRERLNTAPSVKRRDEILSDEGFQFTYPEFQEGYLNLLTLCQEAEAAEQLQEFKSWWEILTYLLEPGIGSNGCSSCCGQKPNGKECRS